MNRTEIARQTLAAQTVAELRDLAREAGIRGRSAMRKAELVELLIPTQLAEQAELATRRATAEADRETTLAARQWDSSLGARMVDGSLVAAAIRAKETYLEVVGRLGAENGGPAVSIAWEDYLDACFAAETCTFTTCWDRATDGDGRCGRHSHGPALGDDVAQSAETELGEVCSEPDCEVEAVAHDSRCLPHAKAAGDACFAEDLQLDPFATEVELDWAAEVLRPADVWARVQATKEAAMAELKRALPQSGYTDCACRDCFDAAISSDVRFPEPCQGCVEDECELGDTECNRAEAYGE